MDPLERADRTLRRAATRRDVVTPETAVSPMDAATTQELPKAAIAAAAREEPVTDPFTVQQPAPPGAREDTDMRTAPLPVPGAGVAGPPPVEAPLPSYAPSSEASAPPYPSDPSVPGYAAEGSSAPASNTAGSSVASSGGEDGEQPRRPSPRPSPRPRREG